MSISNTNQVKLFHVTLLTLHNDWAVCTSSYCRQHTGNVYCIILAPSTRPQSTGLSRLRAMLASYHKLQAKNNLWV